LASSADITISGVSVQDNNGGNISVAGVWLSSNAAFSYSTVSVNADPYALWVAGSFNRVTQSSITNNGYGTVGPWN